MRPANGLVRRATLAACATLLAALAETGGCAVPTPTTTSTPAAGVARVDLVNLSQCDWQVTLTDSVSHQDRTVSLATRETVHLELPGGDYVITQTALAGVSAPESTRQFPAHLVAGDAYRWRLVTLFSGTAAAP